ncbi:MAG: hypothetical protein KAW12_17245 [Candidatus Aminicenantes bacterium]|nr:hypothetical protein [Candidatus Aminicenantes bacterium]
MGHIRFCSAAGSNTIVPSSPYGSSRNNPTLAGTHPHHKHIPPDIKHHRIPAPNMSFDRSNLPVLIKEIEELL